MRFPAVALAAALCAAAGAQSFGTKKDILPPPTMGTASPGVGLMPFVQMLVALGVVLLLIKFALPKLVGKLNKRLVTGVGSGIRIEESASFAGGNLYVVSARAKTLLLSVSPSGVNCLADLTETQSAPQAPLFMDILEAEQQKPTTSYSPSHFQPQAAPLAPEDIQAAIDRLNRLAQ